MKLKEKDYEGYLLKHNPKRVATGFCQDCNEVIRMDRLEFHKCPKTKQKEKELFYKKKGKIDSEVAQDILDSFREGETQGFSKGIKGSEGVIKYDEGYCFNCKKSVRDGVIKEIEKLLINYKIGISLTNIYQNHYLISKKEWEGFKHGKK